MKSIEIQTENSYYQEQQNNQTNKHQL